MTAAHEGSGFLRLVMGDQLSPEMSSLKGIDRQNDIVLIAEVLEEATYVPHHPKKIAFIFSAMRHFAEELALSGISVSYVRLDDAGNTGSLFGEVQRAVEKHGLSRVIVTEPGEYRLKSAMASWSGALGRPVTVLADDRFLCGHQTFRDWASGRKQLRMEYFYRDMRRRTGLLMTADGQPEGGQWNFDHDNRKAMPESVRSPPAQRVSPDSVTRAVLDMVSNRFGGGYDNQGHFGDLEPFGYAVTRADAQAAFRSFVDLSLPDFGAFQDAMRPGDPFLFHSVSALYLNAGLLDALTLCRVVESAYYSGHAPLNAVEGFIRQIIGWREYCRGIYWLSMPHYAGTNVLNAHRPLPEFYWTGRTSMACMADVIDQTRRHAYAHHIQRLMITGNFALLIGVEPRAVEEWYLAVYADAYEWVELPNTHGMALYADGGLMASKPYAAGGAYIDRMSSYCKGCQYDVKAKTGKTACPFNYLYWDFLVRNRDTLRSNQRLAMIYKTLDRMSPGRIADIRADSAAFLDGLASSELELGGGPDAQSADLFAHAEKRQ